MTETHKFSLNSLLFSPVKNAPKLLHSYTLVILQTTSAFFAQALKTMMQLLCVTNELTSEHENPNVANSPESDSLA